MSTSPCAARASNRQPNPPSVVDEEEIDVQMTVAAMAQGSVIGNSTRSGRPVSEIDRNWLQIGGETLGKRRGVKVGFANASSVHRARLAEQLPPRRFRWRCADRARSGKDELRQAIEDAVQCAQLGRVASQQLQVGGGWITL